MLQEVLFILRFEWIEINICHFLLRWDAVFRERLHTVINTYMNSNKVIKQWIVYVCARAIVWIYKYNVHIESVYMHPIRNYIVRIFFFFLVISTLPMHFSGHGKILEILWVHIAHVNKNTEAPDRESNIYKSQIINKRLKCLLFLGWIPSNSLPTSPPSSLSLFLPLFVIVAHG